MGANRAARRREWRETWRTKFANQTGWVFDRNTRREMWKMSWSKIDKILEENNSISV